VSGSFVGGCLCEQGALDGGVVEALWEWVCGGSGALWVGDKFYGRLARLWGCGERVGWLPVVRVEPS
jgi:hypothetical protein